MKKQDANNDPIANALNITPIVKDIGEVIQYNEANTVHEYIQTDYELARLNIHGILEKGENALDELLQIARQSTHPRSYEVLGQFIKTLTETNKDLLNLSKQYKELAYKDAPQKVTNNLYVGTGAELLKLLKKTKEDNGTE